MAFGAGNLEERFQPCGIEPDIEITDGRFADVVIDAEIKTFGRPAIEIEIGIKNDIDIASDIAGKTRARK